MWMISAVQWRRYVGGAYRTCKQQTEHTMLRSFVFGAIALTPGFLLLALRLWLLQRQSLSWSTRGTGRGTRIGIFIAAVTFAAMTSLAQSQIAHARDDGRYEHSANKDWFRSLTNQYGIICCDEAD